ncbi:monocarboxylate transporter 6 [Lingula anatina]|uniref:Monocarboxylate transporter 6 n=1 Tax=Lingula anatina TaxID=7574 RepID=A0A1S3I7C4_LINAN|nr:monocarboxylate transporter 6 [Lingula anatina]|eukprot:XP_013394180.1 monocarboxylate transporter 6 [Lingula anatina]
MAYYGYYILTAVIPASMYFSSIFTSWAEYVAVFSSPTSDLYSSSSALGLNQSLYLAFIFVPSHLTKLLADLLGKPLVIRLGLVLICLGLCLSALAPNIYFLTVSRSVIVGIGINWLITPICFLMAEWFPWQHRFHVLATSSQAIANPLGIVLFPLAIRWIIEISNWRYSFLFLAGTAAFYGVIIGLIVRDPRPGEVSNAKKDDVKSDFTAWSEQSKNIIKFIWLAIAVCKGISQSVIYTFLVQYAEAQGFRGLESTYPLTADGAAGFVARLLVAMFGDLIKGRLLYMYVVCALMLSTVCFLLPFAASLPGFIVFGAVLGSGQGPIIAAWYAACNEVLGGESVHELFLLQRVGWGIGLAAGGLVAGLILDVFQSYPMVFFGLGLSYGFILLGQVVIILWNKYREKVSPYGSQIASLSLTKDRQQWSDSE